jgi:signal transduction histidine kinase
VTLAPALLIRGLRPRDLRALDAVLAVALVVACGLAAAEAPQSGGWHEPVVVSLLIPLLIGAPVGFRRLLPQTMLAVSLAFSTVALATGAIPDFASAPIVVTLGCELYLAASLSALILTPLILGAALIVAPGDQGSLIGTAFGCLVVVVAWVLGWIRRERHRHAKQVAEQRTQRAIGDERLRIARELHDIVAHSMSLIAVRASVADHVFGVRPLEAQAALRDIEAASRSALSQLRQVVEGLRDDGGDYAPAPGLADLPALAGRAEAGGVSVRLTVAGEEAIEQVPEAVGLSAFRIVQEALTNTVKHAAAPAVCTITVTVTSAEIRIRAADDGVPAPASGGGHGIIGMRERVAAWGGEFSAGPGDTGGFVVTATLPYRGADT